MAREVSLSWPKDEGHTLDLVFLVSPGAPLCVQCRTGEVTGQIDRLLHVRNQLGLPAENYLLCVSDLTERQADELSQRHGLSVATTDTVKAWFETHVPTGHRLT